MKTLLNKTTKPMRILLHGGHVLHLGPNKTGQIHDDDALRPALKKMMERGEVVLIEDASAEEIPAGAHIEQETKPAPSQRRVVIPIGGRTAAGRRER